MPVVLPAVLPVVLPIVALAITFLLARVCVAQNPPLTPGQQMMKTYAGSDDTETFLNEPKVREELKALLGDELPHLLDNLNVKGSIDLIGGQLSVDGNAPHMGTEEEGVVCVSIYTLEVSAAILSGGTITVYSRPADYTNLPLCVKDWITQGNSGHVDRMTQPKNVRVAGKK